jgi:hypothetical protein
LFWIYKCWFLILKKQKNLSKAENIYKKFLFPSYERSHKFKNKITTFSVILHSKNKEISSKIDRYSDKFLSLLNNILIEEIKMSRQVLNQAQIRCSEIKRNKPKRLGQYCENKHIDILQKLDINEDDSSLSDLEDEILKTCQLQTDPIVYKTQQIVNNISLNKTALPIIFEIKKEKKFSDPVSVVVTEKNTSRKNEMDIDEMIPQNNQYIKQHETLETMASIFTSSPSCSPTQIYSSSSMVHPTCSTKIILPPSLIVPTLKTNFLINDETSSNTKNSIISEKFSEFHKFSKFTEYAQESKEFQPLINLNKEIGLETCHDSRKISNAQMDVDHDIMAVDEDIDETNNYESDVYFSNEISNLRREKSILYSIETQSQINNLSNCKNTFKNPKIYKIDPTLEKCSTFNSYNKPFIPKIRAKEKLKNLVPFLRDFKPKFLKKENIDKKILRKFRNFVKILCKLSPELVSIHNDKNFWKNFTTINLLPPMRYDDDLGIRIEFKSFNTKYLLWLFSKDGCAKLYKDFVTKSGDQILHDFVASYDLKNNLTEDCIIEKLKYYIYAIPEIYSKRANIIEGTTFENYTNGNLTYLTKINSEEILASYLGADLSLSNLNTFNLNNFAETTYPRCGKKITDRYLDDYDNGESYCNFADQSFDSIPSVE